MNAQRQAKMYAKRFVQRRGKRKKIEKNERTEKYVVCMYDACV